MEERLLQKEQVIDLYKSLEQFLRSEDFDEDIKKVLQKSHPKYLEALEKRINDMQRSDYAIVIAGETGAGKSTLINKILGKRIFKEDNLEPTSTICKIRNSEKITLIVEHKSGKTETRDLTDKCDMETKEGIQTLRNILNDLTNMTGSTKGNGYKNVDIGFPIPFLQDGVILLDTPGIGGSREVSDKLMEYLLNAVLFVFVINVGGAGGMQKDRLPKILRSLVHLGIENEMPCFDPRDVLFVTNKWDTIASFDSDSEEEDHQKEQTWRNLRSKIERQWPHVKKEHIFKMSLKEVNVH